MRSLKVVCSCTPLATLPTLISGLLVVAAVLWLFLSDAQAITINVNYNPSLGTPQNPSSPPPNDPNGTRLQQIAQAAADYWEGILLDSRTYNIDVIWQPRTDNRLAVAYAWSPDPLAGNNITFASNRGFFFDDPDSAGRIDHSEFNLGFDAASQTLYRDLSAASQTSMFRGAVPGVLEIGYAGAANGTSAAANQWDLFTVALHEIGHHLGVFGIGETGDGFWDFSPSHLDGNVGMAIPPQDGSHTAPAVTLMAPGLPPATRRLPSTADVLAIAQASAFSQIDLPRKDFVGGTEWHTAANWIGKRVPDRNDDVFIRPLDTVADVELSSAARAHNLFLGGDRTRLSTNDHILDVGALSGGTVIVDGQNQGAALRVNSGGSVQTGNMTLRNGGRLDVQGGEAILFDSSLRVADSGSSLVGHGTVTLFGGERLVNDGLIEPREGTLTLRAVGSGAFDLDGANPTGRLRVERGDLVVDGPLTDAFDGSFTIAGGRTATFQQGWELAGTGSVTGDGVPARVAGNMVLSGALTTQANAVLNLPDQLTTTPSAVLDVAAGAVNLLLGPVTYGGGVITGGGRISQEGNAFVTADTMIDVATYDLDGQGFFAGGESTTTIADAVTLTINSAAINATTPGRFSGTLLLDGGQLVANIDSRAVDFVLRDAASAFEPDASATLTFRDNGGGIPQYGGSRLVVGANGIINIESRGAGSFLAPLARIDAPTRFESGLVNVDDGMTLAFHDSNEFVGLTRFVGNAGVVRLAESSQTTVEGTLIVEPSLELSGMLQGTGIVAANLDAFLTATVEPGSPVGKLTVEGSFASDGAMVINIGGSAESEFGHLSVEGLADIAGSTLEVNLVDLGGGLYEPVAGDSFTILETTGGIVGDFAGVDFPSLQELEWVLLDDRFAITLRALWTADFDEDGDVDGNDFLAWQENFGTTTHSGEGDADGDGDVDGEDFLAWQAQFGSGVGNGRNSAAKVPEPATWLTAISVILAIACHRSITHPESGSQA